jgi:hypothetical protein
MVFRLAVVSSVPDVGNVSDVGPESVHVVGYAPTIVVVLAALLASPVPPRAGPTDETSPTFPPLSYRI